MDAEIAKKILRYGIRAPSTHNSQPWLFKITPSSIQLYIDRSKYCIVEGDPTQRYLYISIGACIENCIIAARTLGYFDRVEFFEHRDNSMVAEIFLKEGFPDESYQNLFDAILTRINVRGIFDAGSIPEDILDTLRNVEVPPGINREIVQDRDQIEKLAKLTAEGLRVAYRNPAFRKEMANWIHSNISRKREGLTGYSLRMGLIPSLILPTLIRFVDIGPKLAKLNYASVVSAQAIILFSSEKKNSSSWRCMGQYIQHLSLLLQSNGIYTSVFVAAIEAGLLGETQFLLCAGYMKHPQPFSPRRPLDDMLIS